MRLMRCKICDLPAKRLFSLPAGKRSGGPLEADGEEVPYYECQSCHFLFAHHEADYGDEYWDTFDPVSDGRVIETLRLFTFAGGRPGVSALDYGCGKGHAVKTLRDLGVEAFGADIKTPWGDWYYPIERAPVADIVTACEVVEHFTDPVRSFKHVRTVARESFAFQTAYYDPGSCGRDWWYLGPANGHVSLYSARSLEVLAEHVQAKVIHKWKGYPGIQAWEF
jgi:SAM-dependent methyltransferase